MSKGDAKMAVSSTQEQVAAAPRQHRWRARAEPCDLCGKRPGLFGNIGFGLISGGHRERCARRKGARKTRGVKLTQADCDEEVERIVFQSSDAARRKAKGPLKTPEEAASSGQGQTSWVNYGHSTWSKTPREAASDERPFNLRPSVGTWCQAKPPQSETPAQAAPEATPPQSETLGEAASRRYLADTWPILLRPSADKWPTTPAQAASPEAQHIDLRPSVATWCQAKPPQRKAAVEEYIVSPCPSPEQSDDEETLATVPSPSKDRRSILKVNTFETVSTRISHANDLGSSSSECDCFDISTPRSNRSEIGDELTPQSLQLPPVQAQQATSKAAFKAASHEGRPVDLRPSVGTWCQARPPLVLLNPAEAKASSKEERPAAFRPVVDTWPVIMRPLMEMFPSPAQAASLEPKAVNLQPFFDMCRPAKDPAEAASKEARPRTLRPSVDMWLKTAAQAKPPIYRPMYDAWRNPAEASRPVNLRPLVEMWKNPAQASSSQAARPVILRPLVEALKTPAQEVRPMPLRPVAETFPRKLQPFVDKWLHVKLPQVKAPGAMEVSPAAWSGEGTLSNVGIKMSGSFPCSECRQRFDSEKAKLLHWKFIHDPTRHQEE